MNLRILFLTLSVFIITALSAQSNNDPVMTVKNSDPVIMTVNGNPVLKSEFEYVYNKNNSNNAIDKKTLEEYVDLFVNFKLKVEEAKAQGLDTTQAFISELGGYRAQLAKPYLIDTSADEDVLKEAYERMKEDIEVSHILIRVDANASAADTLIAWNKAQNALKRLKKEDFSKVAKAVSEDQSVVQNGGNIGWITSFRTIYPFETVAYNTPVGSISQPVRTMFGYHIVKVHNRRNTLGEVLTSHIMKFTSEDDAANETASMKIDSLYRRVLAGDDFGTLAETYSDDKASAVNKGELPWFGTGRMVPEFEMMSFALKNIGDVSIPIRSAYGWHIIKLLDRRGLASYDELKPTLERGVKRDERATRGKQAFVEKLHKQYTVEKKTENLQDFYSLLDGLELNDSAFIAEAAKLSKPLLKIEGKVRTQADFATYLRINSYSEKTVPSEIIADKFVAFVDSELLAHEDSQLEKKHDDFRFLMQEYHDGILLFEVSNKEVWERASRDTEGLKQFFAENRANYDWDKPHYKGRVIYCKDAATLKAAKAIVKKADRDSLDKYLPERLNDSIQYVKIQKGLFVQGDNEVVDNQIFKTKKKPELSEEYPYVFIVGKNLKNKPESYTDVRGLITADYQDYLEKEWIRSIREKHLVTIDEKVLKTVKKN